MATQKIVPHLWYDKEAEEAMQLYVDTFNGAPGKREESKVIGIVRYPGGITEGPAAGMDGKVLTGVFELAGVRMMALDGGPIFKFNESVSLLINCDTQEEIDYFWQKLAADPAGGQCGWTKDKFGLSWQVHPTMLDNYLTDSNPVKVKAVMDAFMPMKKLDIATLEAAYNKA